MLGHVLQAVGQQQPLELEPKSDRIQNALIYARSNLKSVLSLDELAEAARLMLEDGRHTVETVAYETGFADRERMRRAFIRVLGQPPQAVRRALKETRREILKAS